MPYVPGLRAARAPATLAVTAALGDDGSDNVKASVFLALTAALPIFLLHP